MVSEGEGETKDHSVAAIMRNVTSQRQVKATEKISLQWKYIVHSHREPMTALTARSSPRLPWFLRSPPRPAEPLPAVFRSLADSRHNEQRWGLSLIEW